MSGDPGVPPREQETGPGEPKEQPVAPSEPQPQQPLVAWEPPGATSSATFAADGYLGGQPPFTVGALLSDTFARYGADVLRLFLVSAVGSGLSWVSSFAAPLGSNPFVQPTGFVDVSGLLGLLSFVAGFVGSSVMLALAEGGRSLGFVRAFRRGIERSGWLFLTSLLLGVAFIGLFLAALIPLGLFLVISPVLVIVPIIAVFLIFLWASMRLSLALPAVVADNRNSIEAVKLSWRATRPSGVWLRILGASLLLGLMATPAAFAAILLVFPAMFGGGGQLLLLLVPAVAFALFTPLSLLLSFSAHRRLVPPLRPSWADAPGADAPGAGPAPAMDAPAIDAAAVTASPPVEWVDPAAPASPAWTAASPEAPPTAAAAEPPAPAEAPAPAEPAAPAEAPAPADPPPVSSAPPAPAFRVPRLGTAGKAIIALVLAFDVAGVVAIPYGIAQMETLVRDGFPGFPGGPGFPGLPGGDGSVFPGEVAFGSDADLDTCTIDGQLFFATAGTSVEWVASPERTVTPQDEVFLRITRDGQELETTLQPSGTYDCLGGQAPGAGLTQGVYTYEIVVNGSVDATGSLIVQ